MKKNVLKKFQKIVGKGNCFISPEETSGYCFDAFAKSNVFPEVVVAPENAECIPEIIRLCNEENLAVVTRGAGTNLSGGTLPFEGSCVLLTTKLNKIKEINKADHYAVVEAGVITTDIANAAVKAGLFYPPDPGSMNISTIGGNVAENAGGLRGLKYGVTKDYLMGLTLFDAEANKVIGGGRTVKQVTGFNLPGLFAGSEGLLGVMTEFVLKLIPPPESSRSMLVIYDNILKACDTVSEIIAENILPATMELMDNFTIKTVEEATAIGLPVDAGALLLLEIDGHHAQVADEFEKVEYICEKNGGHLKTAEDEESKNKIWEARRKALSSLARLKPTLILEDATVP
ncbi:MAG TPA: glycolate oxidase subunit GlcD, partial [Flexistipes sinusarabici]|nr:glycolate oxidase subunit GlcD [Flexistipes sinusarabici]